MTRNTGTRSKRLRVSGWAPWGDLLAIAALTALAGIALPGGRPVRDAAAPRVLVTVTSVAATSIDARTAPATTSSATSSAANGSLESETEEPLEAPPPRTASIDAGARDLFAADATLAAIRASSSEVAHTAALSVDGRDDTGWVGRAAARRWTWTALLHAPAHVALLRARFGSSTTAGVPVTYRWEARASCDESAPFAAVRDAAESASPDPTPGARTIVAPTRRSWFVDVDACALRLVIERTNGGPPVLHELQALQGARSVLASAGTVADADASLEPFGPANAIDGAYATRWVGAPGRGRWTLTVRLAEPSPVDRIRLVLGFDATSAPRSSHVATLAPPATVVRPIGRTYGVAYAPLRYEIEASTDGVTFEKVADGAPLPVRRPLFRIRRPRLLRAIRVVMHGATGGTGAPDAASEPVIREIAAYRADDRAPILPAPWVMSVNANPAGLSHPGELGNDIYFAKFLQLRFSAWMASMKRDDRYARAMGWHGEVLDAPPDDHSGSALEAIEGDDATFDGQLISLSSPPPIVVLSGANAWEFARHSRPETDVRFASTRAPERAPHPEKRWRWNPLETADRGGMGQIAGAVKRRAAPFLGFCGGAQILALLEARETRTAGDRRDGEWAADGAEIDRILRRNTGRPIRGWAPPTALGRAWPGEAQRTAVAFDPHDPLFVDIAGVNLRHVTRALPESHFDVVRPDAFRANAPLARFDVLATSLFCSPDVVGAGPFDAAIPNPTGKGHCARVPEVFRSRDPGYPVIGAQFHAEQLDFQNAADGDPPESVADGRLFMAAAYEEIVDAYAAYGD